MERHSFSSRCQSSTAYHADTASQQPATANKPMATSVCLDQADQPLMATDSAAAQQSAHKRLHKVGSWLWLCGFVMFGSLYGDMALAGVAICSAGVVLMAAAAVLASGPAKAA